MQVPDWPGWRGCVAPQVTPSVALSCNGCSPSRFDGGDWLWRKKLTGLVFQLDYRERNPNQDQWNLTCVFNGFSR